MRLSSRGGRNSAGRVTTRHQGGGNKRLYRVVEFNPPVGTAAVLTVEYDPYRTSFIALVQYENGTKAYFLAPQNVKVGDSLVVGEAAPIKPGNRLKLKNIPVGMQIFNVEIEPGKGGQMVRSAGNYAELLALSGKYADVKLPSGEVRRVSSEGMATIGTLSNQEWNLVHIGKAGRSRWLGIRPTVRGTAMNPVDHPYGGGEGVQPRGTKRPKSYTGKVTGGRKTRSYRKSSNKLIVKRRNK
jgi:large subunit ribosomal protein L2